jgi:hypothetical protein
MVAQVCHYYPGLAPQVIDGTIAAPMFFLLVRMLRRVRALGRVDTAKAVMIGAAIVMSGDKALPLAEDDRKEAFPDE